MIYLGDFKKNDVVYYIWNTVGVSGWTSVNPSESGVVGVYQNTTAAMSVGDAVYNVGFDGLVGLNDITIPTSGAFFTVGADYIVAISGAVIDGETVNAALCSFSLQNRSVLMETLDSVSGNITNLAGTVDTVSGNVTSLDVEIYALSGIVVEFSGGLSTPDYLAAHVADYVVASGNVAGWNDDIVTVSGIAPEALSEMVASGNAEGWNNDLDGVMVSGIMPGALSEIVASGNAEGWNDDIVTVSGIAPEALSEFVASGNAEGWNNDLDGVVVSGIMPEALSEIVASGNAEGWNNDLDGVVVSGIMPGALSEIVASGNDAGWNDIAIDTTLGDIVSGVWEQDLDNGHFTTSGYAGQKIRNLHLLNLGAAQIVPSGAAQYMRIYNNVTPTGTVDFEFRLYNQTNNDPTVSAMAITGRDRITE